MTMRFGAVVLAGGRARRLGGADKASLTYDGSTFLERACEAVRAAEEIVVVGPSTLRHDGAVVVREEPPYGGPAAALLTGHRALVGDASVLVAIAVDMPLLDARAVDLLLESAAEGHGAVLTDAVGRRQLALALKRAPLREIEPPRQEWSDLPVWKLLAPLRLAEVTALADHAADVDTRDDLARLRKPG